MSRARPGLRGLQRDRGFVGWSAAVILTVLLTAGIPMTTSAFTATVTNTDDSVSAKSRFLCADTFAGERRKQRAYFEFALTEEADATTAQDSSDAGNTGTYEGSSAKDTASPTACSYDAGSAYALDGSSSRVLTALRDGPIVSDFSEDIWFKASSPGKLMGYEIERAGESSNYDKHLYIDANNRLRYGTDGNGVQTLATDGSVADGTWHHAVATTSSTDGSLLYLDGAVVAKDATMTAGEPFSGYWRIGEGKLAGWPDDPGRRYFTGALRFAAAYPYVLTAAEVASEWSIGQPSLRTVRPVKPTRPVADPGTETATATATETAMPVSSAPAATDSTATTAQAEPATADTLDEDQGAVSIAG